MKKAILIFIISVSVSYSQSIYFPPLTGNTWETVTPASLGWNTEQIDSLYNFLQAKNTKAFIVLKNGKIGLEKYFDTFSSDSIWYWASAGKTLIAFLVGIAQHEGYFNLTDTSSKYLGNGWTSCPLEKEKKITILNQLTMTSGLKDNVPDPYCTLPSCLIYLTDAGTRWGYHNAPYTLLDSVVMKSTGQSYNQYFFSRIRNRIGMNGLWFPSGYNNVYFSNARSMARFGILVQNNGIWSADTLMKDTSYFRKMINTSQNINLSYGYLWWLNGKSSYMLPKTQFIFPGSWAPDAPEDMIAALGKDGQILNVVPSMGIVLVRMGETPDSSLEITPYFNNEIWQKLNAVISNPSDIKSEKEVLSDFTLHQNYPNPFNPSTIIRYSIPSNVKGETPNVLLKVYDVLGNEVATLIDECKSAGVYEVSFEPASSNKYPASGGRDLASGIGYASGVYFYQLRIGDQLQTKKMILLR